MICDGPLQRCAAISDYRNWLFRCALTISPKGEDGQPLPALTNIVYNLSAVGRVERKRKVLDAWAAELRRIIGDPAAVELPFAA